MTREEYKRRYELATFKHHAESLIDNIYDDFESRTCESCKFYLGSKIFKGKEVRGCNLPEENVLIIPSKDFGCNKWEKKDD